MSRLFAVFIMTLAVVACTQDSGTAIGIVTAVEGDLVEVTSFRVVSSGSELEFLTVPGREYDFDLPHLREHMRTAEQVIVEWEIRDDLRYALEISDA